MKAIPTVQDPIACRQAVESASLLHAPLLIEEALRLCITTADRLRTALDEARRELARVKLRDQFQPDSIDQYRSYSRWLLALGMILAAVFAIAIPGGLAEKLLVGLGVPLLSVGVGVGTSRFLGRADESGRYMPDTGIWRTRMRFHRLSQSFALAAAFLVVGWTVFRFALADAPDVVYRGVLVALFVISELVCFTWAAVLRFAYEYWSYSEAIRERIGELTRRTEINHALTAWLRRKRESTERRSRSQVASGAVRLDASPRTGTRRRHSPQKPLGRPIGTTVIPLLLLFGCASQDEPREVVWHETDATPCFLALDETASWFDADVHGGVIRELSESFGEIVAGCTSITPQRFSDRESVVFGYQERIPLPSPFGHWDAAPSAMGTIAAAFDGQRANAAKLRQANGYDGAYSDALRRTWRDIEPMLRVREPRSDTSTDLVSVFRKASRFSKAVIVSDGIPCGPETNVSSLALSESTIALVLVPGNRKADTPARSIECAARWMEILPISVLSYRELSRFSWDGLNSDEIAGIGADIVRR